MHESIQVATLCMLIYLRYSAPLNALLCLNENILATGDDDGVIKVGILKGWEKKKDNTWLTQVLALG